VIENVEGFRLTPGVAEKAGPRAVCLRPLDLTPVLLEHLCGRLEGLLGLGLPLFCERLCEHAERDAALGRIVVTERNEGLAREALRLLRLREQQGSLRLVGAQVPEIEGFGSSARPCIIMIVPQRRWARARWSVSSVTSSSAIAFRT
jgi:hypothetical protein